MKYLIRRNLTVFFRDRANVFFSLLGVIIMIGLYMLFLGELTVSSMEGVAGARFLVDSWIMSGVLAVTSMTATLGAFGIMIEDRSKKIIKDFAASPLKRREFSAGYIISAVLIGIILSIVAFIFAEIYIVIYGGSLLPPLSILKLLGCIVLSVLSSGSMMFFAVSFLKSLNAFSVASTIIGTMAGFLSGVYIPVGQLPGAVQMVVKLFPVSHSALVFKSIMLERPMAATFEGAPASALAEFKNDMGVVFTFGKVTVDWPGALCVMGATLLVFFFLGMWNLSRKAK